MDSELCHWCQEMLPAEYAFPPETPSWKRVCRECFAKLSPEQRQRIVETPDPPRPDVKPAPVPEMRGCPRCRRAMVSGVLMGSAPAPIAWAQIERRQGLLGWVDAPGVRASISAWRCGRCGYCELATTPDAPGTDDTPGEEAETAPVRKRSRDDPSVL